MGGAPGQEDTGIGFGLEEDDQEEYRPRDDEGNPFSPAVVEKSVLACMNV